MGARREWMRKSAISWMMGDVSQAWRSWKEGKLVRRDLTGSFSLFKISSPSLSRGRSSRAYIMVMHLISVSVRIKVGAGVGVGLSIKGCDWTRTKLQDRVRDRVNISVRMEVALWVDQQFCVGVRMTSVTWVIRNNKWSSKWGGRCLLHDLTRELDERRNARRNLDVVDHGVELIDAVRVQEPRRIPLAEQTVVILGKPPTWDYVC